MIEENSYDRTSRSLAREAGNLDVWKKALEGFAGVKSVMVEGWKGEGKAETLQAVLKAKFGKLPDDLSAKLALPGSLDSLTKWTVSAAMADTLEKFREASGL